VTITFTPDSLALIAVLSVIYSLCRILILRDISFPGLRIGLLAAIGAVVIKYKTGMSLSVTSISYIAIIAAIWLWIIALTIRDFVQNRRQQKSPTQ